MIRTKSFMLFACAISVMSLAACGEGWEAVRTSDIVPYGNSRTAGSTIMYVQKKMMPAKELNVEPAVEDVVTTSESLDLSKDEMNGLFSKAQSK